MHLILEVYSPEKAHCFVYIGVRLILKVHSPENRIALCIYRCAFDSKGAFTGKTHCFVYRCAFDSKGAITGRTHCFVYIGVHLILKVHSPEKALLYSALYNNVGVHLILKVHSPEKRNAL